MMSSVSLCDCCGVNTPTRVCLSCNPGGLPVNMCSACTERAHFGPMKLSHQVESLINKRLKEKLLQQTNDWKDQNKKRIQLCSTDLDGCLNDLENQKRTDTELITAAFEQPLRSAVVKKKKELLSQIALYYDSRKPELAQCIAKCKEYSLSIDKIATDVSLLDESCPDQDFEQEVLNLESSQEVNSFDPQVVYNSLPALKDTHRLTDACRNSMDQILSLIESMAIEVAPNVLSDETITSLTLAPGDVIDVVSNAMEKDGIFWLKLCVPPEKSVKLYQIAYNFRRSLISGELKRYNDHPQDLYTGMIVMALHPEDSIWYRAVVTDPCIGDIERRPHAAVVIADTGYKLDVPHSHLAECSPECLTMPLLAVPCSLYPEEHPVLGHEPRWKYNDSIKETGGPSRGRPKQLVAKFVHRKSAQHVTVPVWYVELADKDGNSYNKLVEDQRLQSTVAKGQINNKDIRVTTGEIKETLRELCVTKDGDNMNAQTSTEPPATPLSAIDPVYRGGSKKKADIPPVNAEDQTIESNTQDSSSAAEPESTSPTTDAQIVGADVELDAEKQNTKLDEEHQSAEPGQSESELVCPQIAHAEEGEITNETCPATTLQSSQPTDMPPSPQPQTSDTDATKSNEKTDEGDVVSSAESATMLSDVKSNVVNEWQDSGIVIEEASNSCAQQDESSSQHSSNTEGKRKYPNKKKKRKLSRKGSVCSNEGSQQSLTDQSESSESQKRNTTGPKARVAVRTAIRSWITSPGRESTSLPSLLVDSNSRSEDKNNKPSKNQQYSDEPSVPDGQVSVSNDFPDNSSPQRLVNEMVSQRQDEVGQQPSPDKNDEQEGDKKKKDASSDDWDESMGEILIPAANPFSVEAPPPASGGLTDHHPSRHGDHVIRDRSCFACGGYGHWARQCPEKTKIVPSVKKFCTVCKQTTHNAEFCGFAKEMYYNKGCPMCLTTEHKFIECKKPRIDFNFLKAGRPAYKKYNGGRQAHNH